MNRGSIPEHVIDAVLKGHDLVEVVGRHVSLTKRGKNYVGLCPFHSEKTPSFHVSREKQIFKCFGCGKGGNVIQFVMEAEGLPFPEAVRMLAQQIRLPFRWEEGTDRLSPAQRDKLRLFEAHELASKWYHNILLNTAAGNPAMEYLIGRGFSQKAIETFRIGYAPPMRDTLARFLDKRGFPADLMCKGGLLRSTDSGTADLFRDRVMFPICDPAGKVIAFGGRAVGGGEPKYLNTPESPVFRKSRVLYNLDRARPDIRKKNQIVLFEGYVDVIRAWEAGVPNGVAAMGTSLTDEHAAVLKRYADEIVLCYDGDEAGQKAALSSLSLLEKHGFTVRVALLPDGMDPDEYIGRHGPEKFVRDVVESPVASVRFRLLRLRKQHRLDTEEGKLRYMRASLNVISSLSSATEREHYLRELAAEFQYTFESLKQECDEIRSNLEKSGRRGDNPPYSWNNVMNDGRRTERIPALFPAYHQAERNLLAIMMHEPEIASYVEVNLGDAFNVDIHAAISAYIYAYYAQNGEPDPGKLISMMDSDLGSIAASIALQYSQGAVAPQVIDDYIREIRKAPIQRTIEQKKKELLSAERAGDIERALALGNEIITLERQLKNMQGHSFQGGGS